MEIRKNKILIDLKTFLLVGCFLFVVQMDVAGQRIKHHKDNPFWYNWSADLNLGLTSYYGDLSQYDGDYILKLIHESNPAIALKITKYFDYKIGVSGQFMVGGFNSDFKEDNIFRTKLFEYNIQANVDVLNIINDFNRRNSGITLYAGIGQFFFKTTSELTTAGVKTVEVHNSGVPEFVYFFGSTLYHKIHPRFYLLMDLSIRQAQNDNLDNFVKNDDFDYYSFISIGISLQINNLKYPFEKLSDCPAYGGNKRY